MSASEKVRAWRERLRETGKVPVTLWLDAATKARLDDLAFHQRCSPSDLAQQALDAYRPGSSPIAVTVTDTQQIHALIQQEVAQGTAALTASITATVTDIVTATMTARLPVLVEETVQTVLATQGSARPTAPHAQPLPVTDIITDITTETAVPPGEPAAAQTQPLPATDMVTDTTTDTTVPPGESMAPRAQPLSITDIVTDTTTDTTTPLFDETRYFLGELCRKGHAYHASGQSLRRLSDNECLECQAARARAARQRKRQAQPASRRSAARGLQTQNAWPRRHKAPRTTAHR